MLFRKKNTFTAYTRKNIGVVGLGLIGSSIARALRLASGEYNVIGVDTDRETLDYAFDNDIICLGHTDIKILRGCEVVFVAVPVGAVSAVIKEVYRELKGTAVITDVCGVKERIFKGLPSGIRFVGGHPMAGSERGGVREGRAHLFENAYYVLVKDHLTPEADYDAVYALVKEMKALPLELTAKEHDEAVSAVSHLPHMIAFSLVNSVLGGRETAPALNKSDAAAVERLGLPAEREGAEADADPRKRIAAGSFRDITRVASSDPQFWADSAVFNRQNLLTAITGFESGLSRLKDLLEKGREAELKEYFASAKELRDGLDTGVSGLSGHALYIDVTDKPGSIAKITGKLAKKGINIMNIAVTNSREGAGGALAVTFLTEKDRAKAALLLGLKQQTLK